ncbi:MAG: cation transporter dimerization domain-containing protein [Clostridia bacterium]
MRLSDAFNDIISTSCIIAALIISRYTNVNLDGYAGLLISVIIIVAGIKIITEALNPLLGERPCAELVEKISKKLNDNPNVLGMHDLTIHNYGPNRNFASVHVEVDAKVDILVSHDMIDNIEREFREDNIFLVVHLDPVIIDDMATLEIKSKTIEKLKEINADLTLHDFRMVVGATHSNLIFDIVVPFEFHISDDDLIQLMQNKVKEINENYFAVIEIDRNYVL